ncbi:MAG: SsrA-binding protein SmpB [Parcubacteria group bacterium]|nr:SsrA-binding protein SmpB [Parcubacteria group bacterium]
MALVENKYIGREYEILEKFDAGIELLGHEVKSLKGGRGSLKGAYVIIRGNEAFLTGMHVPAYQPANTPKGYDEYRPRRLLLTKKEISRLLGLEKERGLTILPKMVYNKGNKLKVALVVVRKLKKHDKRELLKKKEASRETERFLKEER